MSYLLCVDDEPELRHLVSRLLEQGGHEVRAVEDGAAALAAIAEREPELIILDVAMPGMTGTELCQVLKGNPFTARIPVLILSARSEVEQRIAVLESGADDYLAKPFHPRELRARVAALLRLVRRERDCHPTSGLPGVRAIQEAIDVRVSRGQCFALCYLDLDHFKAFADTFGFSLADRVIEATAEVMTEAVETYGGRDDVVGHIGGDDFLIVTEASRVEAIAGHCKAGFRRVIEAELGTEAMAKGVFRGVDREGRHRDFPVAGLSAVGLVVEPEKWISTVHLGSFAADLKRRARQQGGQQVLIQPVT